jgi:quinol monooxygenase YgiN
MIVITGSFDCRPERRDDFLAAVQALVGPTRAEPGCAEYVISADLDDRNRFYAIEQWRDHDAFRAHAKSAHVQAWFEVADDLVAASNVTRWVDPTDGKRLL